MLDQAGAASASTTRTTKRTSAVIDGMMSVVHFAQVKQAGCALRDLSQPKERSPPRERERRSSGCEGQRGQCDRDSGDGGLQRQEKEPQREETTTKNQVRR